MLYSRFKPLTVAPYAALCLLGLFAQSNGEQPKTLSQKDYPLFEGLDTYKIATSSPSTEAQKYFNQGLMLFYGYNYPEAARSFKAAALLDPQCGVNYWGQSLSLCDCIDNPGDRWHMEALQAYRLAVGAIAGGTDKEKELIEALDGRFQNNYKPRTSPASVFAERMQVLHHKYPDDPDIAAIFANVGTKVVDLYDGVRGGESAADAKDVIDALESGMKKYPYHPGLNHFYIHAMEAAGTPEKALEAAIRLDNFVPGSGHLQHMPAHIYFLYGKYHDATLCNQRGIAADDAMFEAGGVKDPEFAGFYLHNYYFLFNSLAMEGRSKEDLAASRKLVKRLQEGDLPSTPYLRDIFYSVPFLLIARFGMWDELAHEPMPPKENLFAIGMREYALGLAALAQGNGAESARALKKLENGMRAYAHMKGTPQYYTEPVAKLFQLANLDLEGRIEGSKGNLDKEIEELNQAIAIEDTLDFHMLTWYMPLRHSLGAALLAANRPADAEKAYLEDLKKHPHNGWALIGMVNSLEAQQKTEEAENYKTQFTESWKYADFPLHSSRF